MIACLSPNGMNTYRGEAACRRLLVGTIKGVTVLERDGGAWRQADTVLEGQHISALLIEPKHGGLFAGVHRGGVHFSADGGQTWEERSNGLTIPHVYTLAVTEEAGSPVIYAGTEPVGLFRTRDEGKNWEKVSDASSLSGQDKWVFPMPPHVSHLKTMAFDPRDTRSILIGVEQGGLFRTTDGGATWCELDEYFRPEDEIYKDLHQIARRPHHPNELFMTTGMGFYSSVDDGETWTHLTDPKFRIGYPDKLVFSPHDDGVIFMCGADDNPGTWIKRHTANPAIMVSHDLGRSWATATNGLPADMVPSIEALSVYAEAGNLSLFVGTTAGEVYASEDGAKTWRLIAEGLGPVSKVAHFRLLLPGGPGGPGGPPGQAPAARPQA